MHDVTATIAVEARQDPDLAALQCETVSFQPISCGSGGFPSRSDDLEVHQVHVHGMEETQQAEQRTILEVPKISTSP